MNFLIFSSQLEEMKTMQKLRDRPNGVNIISLALGEKLSQEEEKLMVSYEIFNYLSFNIKMTYCVCIHGIFILNLINFYYISIVKLDGIVK